MPRFPRNNHYNYRGGISMKSVKTWGRVLWGKKQLGPVLKEQQNHKDSRRIG